MIEICKVSDSAAKVISWDARTAGKGHKVLGGTMDLQFSSYLEYGEISRFQVKPGCRRDGVGRGMMFAAEKWFRSHGIHRVFCEVPWDADLSAVPFLQAMGFITLPEGEGIQLMKDLKMTGEELEEEGGAA